MIKDISIGKFYYVESVIHKLDPRVKIFSVLVYICMTFVLDTWLGIVISTIALIGVILLSKIPFKYIAKGLKPMLFVLAFSMIIKGISDRQILSALLMGARIVLLVCGASMLTYTTLPNSLTDGFEYILKPLKIFKVPVSEVAMMMSIALRFIPIMVDEANKIIDAQKARGADFENGNLIKRIGKMMPLLVPLFVSAYNRANDLALAMDSRCYVGGKGRTKMKPMKLRKRDLVAILFIMIYIGVMIYFG